MGRRGRRPARRSRRGDEITYEPPSGREGDRLQWKEPAGLRGWHNYIITRSPSVAYGASSLPEGALALPFFRLSPILFFLCRIISGGETPPLRLENGKCKIIVDFLLAGENPP